MDELSQNEKKVLLTLEKIGNSTPEQIVNRGNFKQLVEVMNASSWLQAKELVTISEEITTYYRLGNEGVEYLVKGLPEQRILKKIKENNGSVPMKELFMSKDLTKNEISIGIGYIKKNPNVQIIKGNLTADIETMNELDKTFSNIFGTLEKIGDNKELKEAKIPTDILSHIKARQKIVKHRDSVTRIISLTKAGKKIIDQGIVIREEIAQITPELIQSGNWKNVDFRKYDASTFAPSIYGGRIHPLRNWIEQIRKIFLEMGFEEISGDFVESSFWNMDVLFIPQDHPARELQDTFYLSVPEKFEIKDKQLMKIVKDIHETGGNSGSDGWKYEWREDIAKKAMLRTHTTVNTIRYLSKNNKPPVKVFSIERIFRNEATDATHLAELHQIEGILMEKGANLRMLIGILTEFYKRIGFKEIKILPSYYPYTEPSLDVLVKFKGKWLELGGSGIFRPEVTAPFNVKYPVLAWGLGLERLAMLKLGLKDIRELYISDIDWLRECSLV